VGRREYWSKLDKVDLGEKQNLLHFEMEQYLIIKAFLLEISY
jgi:hypothetical protein